VDKGEVLLDGVNIQDLDKESLRKSFSLVNQFPYIFDMTIKENLLLAKNNATEEELVNALEQASLYEFVKNLPKGIDTKVGESGIKLSGGQKQRLCIARALIKKPKILILDDSTSAVDTRTDALIRKGFKEYIPNTTKLIIAQRIASVKEADKIIVFDGGKINAVGTHDELVKTNEIYRGVYEAQSKGGASLEG